MARPVRMPPLGETTDELRVVEWLKAEGERVAVGDPLLLVETDKATMEVEAASGGTLLRIVHRAGSAVPVGTVLAYLGKPGEDVAADERRVAAAPAVRRLAKEHGIDLAQVHGSGPGGRIEKTDVMALVEGEGVALPRHRRAIAERLTRSVREIPQFTLGVTVDMTRAAALVGDEVTYTHLLLRAMARALRKHPEVNRVWAGDRLRELPRADVGLAVAGEETLLVVTIPEPDACSLAELAELVGHASREAREGRLSERYRGPVSVTLSNLGMIGVDWFAAIVDPDQTAILAAGAVAERPAVVGGEVRPVPQLELTLAADHRVLDGVAAGRFLAAIRTHLEQTD